LEISAEKALSLFISFFGGERWKILRQWRVRIQGFRIQGFSKQGFSILAYSGYRFSNL